MRLRHVLAAGAYFFAALFYSAEDYNCIIYADDSVSRTAAGQMENATVWGFEIGGIIGMPSGLNLRYMTRSGFGADLTIGSTVGRDFAAAIDLLYHPFSIYTSADHSMYFFFGAGTFNGYVEGSYYNNIRIPVGLSMPFSSHPVSFSLYAAPAYITFPEKGFDVNWGVAARYSFGTASALSDIRKGMRSELDKVRGLHAAVSGQLNRTSADLDRTRAELERTRADLDAAIGELKKTKSELGAAKGELTGTREDLGKTIEKLTAFSNELEDTRSRLESTRISLDSATDELAETKGQLIIVKKELDNVKHELDSAKEELARARRRIDDRETELRERQAELENARNIINEALTGKERELEEQRLAKRQEEINRDAEAIRKERDEWQRKKEKQLASINRLKTECEARRGVINEEGYCDCRIHEQWNSDRSACVCVKGYRLHSGTDRCAPCEIVNYSGECTASCAPDERMVGLEKGPHKFACVKRCTGRNEVWSERRNSCVCRDGFSRDSSGVCQPRR